MNRIYELTPSPEESVVPRILVLVHQAVDEHFPSAEKAGRQFSKTVFSDELTEKTAGDRSTSPDDGMTTIPAPPIPGLGKASVGSGGGDLLAKTAPPLIPPPPSTKSVEKNNVTGPNPSPFPPASSQEGAGDFVSRNEQLHSSFPSDEVPTEERESGKERLETGKTDKDRNSLEDRPGKRSRTDQGAIGVDWTTRITLALLLAGILLLGYVVFL